MNFLPDEMRPVFEEEDALPPGPVQYDVLDDLDEPYELHERGHMIVSAHREDRFQLTQR